MIKLPGYRITTQINSGFGTVIYRGIREADQKPVVLKVLRSEYPTREDITRLSQEYAIARSLNSEGIIRAYALEVHHNSYALVLEDFGGQSLKQQLDKEQSLPLPEVLRIAIGLADTLEHLHQIPVIHKDIKPSNIIVNSETGQVKLTDFGIASRLGVENQNPSNPNWLEGTLAYMSPEQTGRMNRSIDYRTDFYALGATLYEMLAGRVPFTVTDPMELVRCHLAIQPVPPHKFNPEIPEVVSELVLKLLAKTAEDRYQSGAGLKYDLEQCFKKWQEKEKIEGFSLGKRDRSPTLLIPQKLYGREREVETLLAAFARVGGGSGFVTDGTDGGSGVVTDETDGSRSEGVLVSGYSGIGKTRIVNEVHKPIARSRGYFIAGKFDQFKRHIPYSAPIRAFSELVARLLTESEATIATWKAKILDALGANGRVIVDVIPELEAILGQQPEVPQLDPTESQNRLNRVFQEFIGVFCQKEHPLVLFLDDLQWADRASLKLIQLLMSDPDRQYLLFIGAYRDNEVSTGHPLLQAIENIREAGGLLTDITVEPLQRDRVRQLVAETLAGGGSGISSGISSEISSDNKNSNENTARTQQLADLLFEKTQGNPFFATQLLKTLHQERLVVYNPSSNTWQWDIAEIQGVGIADYNIVELIARNLRKLPEDTQDILKLAACIGNSFNLDILAIAAQKSESETAIALWEALAAGSVLPLSNSYKITLLGEWGMGHGAWASGGENAVSSLGELPDASPLQKSSQYHKPNAQCPITYKFLHDRVQQAAYSLIPESQKKETHLKIGQLLLENTSEAELQENIFDLVNQLNYGTDLLASWAEKDELANLNSIAGRKAKASAAYEAALNYFNVGLELLGSDSWQRNYELSLPLYTEAIEVFYLNAKFERAESLVEIVLQRGANLGDRVKAYELKMQMYMAQLRTKEAIETGLQVLKLLDVELEREAPGDIAIEELIHLPAAIDPDKLAALRILSSLIVPAYMADPALLPQVLFTMIRLSVNYGNASHSAYGYVIYAVLLCGPLGNIDAGYRYGTLALKVLEKFEAKWLKAKVLIMFNIFCAVLKQHLQETLEPVQEALQSGLETGDLEFASYSANDYCVHRLFMGEELEALDRQYVSYLSLLEKLGQEFAIHYQKIYRQLILNLLGKAEDSRRLVGAAFNEAEMLPLLQEQQNANLLYVVYSTKTFLLYLFGDYPGAVASGREIGQYAAASSGIPAAALHNLCYSLGLLALCRSADNSTDNNSADNRQKSEYLDIVAANQEILKTWASHAPMNFQHKYDLVAAERARVVGKTWEAAELYDRAITGAGEQGYPHEQALANELAGEFHLDRGQQGMGRFYIIEAYYGYVRWGAVAKVRHLEERYPQFLSQIARPKSRENSFDLDLARTVTSTTTVSSSQFLDLPAALKASQAISEEIVLDKLLAKLIEIAIDNAGAEIGAILLQRQGQLIVAAKHWRKNSDLERQDNANQSYPDISPDISPNISPDISLDISPAVSPEQLPVSVLNYVARTQKNLVLDNAAQNQTFNQDSYIEKYGIKSVICTPMVKQGQFIGLIYLENNLVEGAFTSDRIQILHLLSSQAAISLENARLYQDLQQYLDHLKQAQLQLVQSEKMSSIGSLVAGVAHEINNPVGFIAGNIEYATEYSEDLINLLHLYLQKYPEPDPEIQSELDSLDLDFIAEDLPKLISSMKAGTDRIRQISTSLRVFSRSDAAKKVIFNIHDGIDSTVMILKHRLKANETRPEIEIKKNYGDLPEVCCYPGQLNQVFMNILANAIDALDDFNRGRDYDEILAQPNRIVISTEVGHWALSIGHGASGDGDNREPFGKLRRDKETRGQWDLGATISNTKLITQDSKLEAKNSPQCPMLPTSNPSQERSAQCPIPNSIIIRIKDNGPGMPEEVKDKLFEHLFTTKPPGKGTGLGLSIAQQIVEEQHGGKLTVISAPGKGSEFAIEIPLL